MSKNTSGSGGALQYKTTQTQLPDWVNNAAMGNYREATDVANNLLPPWTGQRVADLSPQTMNLYGQLYGNVGSTNPAFAQAGAITNGLAGFNPAMVNPGMLRDTNLQPYMNPYTQAVIDPSMQLLEAQRRNS